MRVLDLFSGIGGIALGLERAGMETVAFCEVDEHCQKILSKHWPDVPCFDDVKELTFMAGKLKKLTPNQVKEAVKMYDSGMSLQDCGEFFGVTRQAMHDLLKRRTKMRLNKKFGSDNHFFRGGVSADSRVHDLTEKAIKRGVLKPGPCEECGSNGTFKDGRNEVQAHHDDYNKPLDVRWLCQKCHHEWHKNNKPIKRKEVGEIDCDQIDMIAGGFPC